MGIKLLFSIAYHPQIDGQTEVVYRTLVLLIRAIIFKNIKSRDECLPFVEFAYNRAIHITTHYSPLQVVYGFNPLTPLDLLPIPSIIFVSEVTTRKADLIKTLHKKVRRELRNKTSKLLQQLTKDERKSFFNPMTAFGYIFTKSDSHLKGRQSYIQEGMTLIKSLRKLITMNIKLIFPENFQYILLSMLLTRVLLM